jgi:hypothetical protein
MDAPVIYGKDFLLTNPLRIEITVYTTCELAGKIFLNI